MLNKRQLPIFAYFTLLAALILIAGSGITWGQAQSVVADRPTVLHAVRAKEPPRIDGRLDDGCWKTAVQITGFLASGSSRPVDRQSIGYLCYDDTHIYVGLKCLLPKGTKPAGEMRPHDSDIFNDDTVEVMLDPGRTGTDYFHMAMNAYGATFDCVRHQSGASEDDAWNGEWQGKSFIGDDYWSAEFAIPYSSLGIKPGIGTSWGLNLFRDAVNPREFSSVGVNGAINEAKEFAVIEGLAVDFSNSLFEIGESVATFDPGSENPRAFLGVTIANMTAKSRKIKLQKERAGADGTTTTESEIVALAARQSLPLRLEEVDIAPITQGSGVYEVRSEPKTKKITLSDAETGLTLASAVVKKPPICETMRLEIGSPTMKGKVISATREIVVKVSTFLPKESLERGKLVVTLSSPDGRKTIETRAMPGPAGEMRVVVPVRSVPWGAYKIRAAFLDTTGHEITSSDATVPVFPGGIGRVRVLNTMVSELMNARERGLLKEKRIAFMNPREGWCFFSLSGNASIILDTEKTPLLGAKAGQKPSEAMRYLSAGRHTLAISQGPVSDLIVQAIPEIQYASLNEHPILESFWKFDWEYLRKIGMLSNLNVFVTRMLDPKTEKPLMDEWTSQGKRLLYETWVPGTYTGGDAEESYGVWAGERGMSDSELIGLIGNEFYGHAGRDKYLTTWAAAIGRLLDEHKDKFFYPYISFYGGPESAVPLVRPLLTNSRCFFANERYISEQPTEERAKKVLESMISDHLRSFQTVLPGSVEKTIFTLSLCAAPPETWDMNPTANFKTLLDMECRMLATDPSCIGLRGVQLYYSRYADEEHMRWASKLFRHYFIEGKTEPLSKDPYTLSHIKNPDFMSGLDGWTVDSAETGSVDTKKMEDYGYIQGRYPRPENGMGDSILWTRRSAVKPNRVSQTIENLQPGRTYSLKMYVADYPGMKSDRKLPISVKIEGTEMLQDRCLQGPFRVTHHPNYPQEKNFINYIRLVFRAKAKTGKLTISDWASDATPGGPIGQELMCNFVQVEPYFMD